MTLPKPGLRIVTDEPGARLLLESDAVALPAGVAAMMSGLVGGVALMAGVADAEQWWHTRRLRVDRAAGVLVLDDLQMLREEERQESIALADVATMTVRTRYVPPTDGRKKSPPFGPGHPRHIEVLVAVTGAAPRVRTVHFEVEGMDTCERVADVAYRLGAAAGLRYQRLVHLDPRRIEIELSAADGPGRQAFAVPEAPADFARGRVAGAAARTAAGPCLAGAVDPARFPSPTRIARWSPGEEVHFDKPMQGMALGCLPVVLGGLLLGPAVWYLMHNVMLTAILTSVGLLFGALGVAGVAMGLPRRVHLAWPAQELTIGGALRKRRIRLDRVTGIEILCTRTYQDARRQRIRHDYACAVRAELRGEGTMETRPEELVSTRMFEQDPDTPYDAVLPIAKELAEALGVPWRVTDYA